MTPDPKEIPVPVIPTEAGLPPIECVRLPNGLYVYLIRSEGQDVARISFVYAAGSALQTKPFAASATLNLLAEGSENFTAHEIAEQLDFHGSYFEVNIDRDYAIATFCCLNRFFAPTLDLAGEIMLRPAFPEEEVAIYTSKRRQSLAVERSKPATKARELFARALFGDDHPYGVSSPEAEYDNLTRADIEDFYRRFYVASNCFVVCSLGTDPAHRDLLLELLGRMPQGEKAADNGFPPPHADRYRFLPLEGAVQSAIRIGRPLFTRSHPDFVGMQVVATLLGGYFGSRLVQNLREEKGYTYGVLAAMINLRETGYLAIATEVAAEATDDAVEQIFAEIERLKTEPVSQDELENAKRSMLGEVMRILDGPFGIVDVVIESIQTCGRNADSVLMRNLSKHLTLAAQPGGNGHSGTAETSLQTGAGEVKCRITDEDQECDYLKSFIREVGSTTPERIMELARKYFDRDEFTTVIVGSGGRNADDGGNGRSELMRNLSNT